MAAQFEITGKIAQRNIAFMCDRLHAPLRYNPAYCGYKYKDNTWEIPGLWLHEDELISLVISYRLAAAVPGKRFAKDVASWITEQSWHPDQKAAFEKEGRLCLTVPVADFREIKREIMRYGAQVEVVSPAALRNEVKKEIEKMKNIYM